MFIELSKENVVGRVYACGVFSGLVTFVYFGRQTNKSAYGNIGLYYVDISFKEGLVL